MASRRGLPRALPRARVPALVSCLGQARARHWLLEVPLATEKALLGNGQWDGPQRLTGRARPLRGWEQRHL